VQSHAATNPEKILYNKCFHRSLLEKETKWSYGWLKHPRLSGMRTPATTETKKWGCKGGRTLQQHPFENLQHQRHL
jgi:hypothetical protein